MGKPSRFEFQLFDNSVIRIDSTGFKNYSASEWPPNNGFALVFDDYLDLRYHFDRFGDAGGKFVAPLGEPY